MQFSYLSVLTIIAATAQADLNISGNTDVIYVDGTTTIIGSAALSRVTGNGMSGLSSNLAAMSSDMAAMSTMMGNGQASSVISSVSSKISSALNAALSSKGDAPSQTGPLAIGAFVAAFSVLLL